MPTHIITKLSDGQEEMLSIYRDKWRSIDIQTEAIDREKVAAVIKTAYAMSNYPEPKILFYGNPRTAIEQILTMEKFQEYLGRNIHLKFSKRVMDHLRHLITRQMESCFFTQLRNRIQFPESPYYPTESNPQVSLFSYGIQRLTEFQILRDIDNPKFEFRDVSDLLGALTRPAGWAIWGCMFDFSISVLGLQHDKQKWKALQELMQYCGFIFQFEKVCIACDRPCKLSFDSENRLHADREPALQFPDGYSVYACHGKHPSEEEQY